RILGKIDLPASFFAINIGLNVALAFTARNLDWGAHLGGFVAAMVTVASLDLIEKANAYALRCKFPEFAKMNLLLLMAASLLIALDADESAWVVVLAAGLVGVVAVKLVDVGLSQRKGLAIVAIGFSIANAALVAFAVALFSSPACRVLLPAANARTR